MILVFLKVQMFGRTVRPNCSVFWPNCSVRPNIEKPMFVWTLMLNETFLWFSNNVCILTIGTLLWLNFRVASDLDRGRKLSKRLVFLVGGVFSPSLDGIWSWWFRFFTTWKLTDPIVAVRGRIMSLGLPVKNKDFKKLSWRARLILADLAKNWCLKR